MKWSIPAKTFLVGEYAAVANGSAIVLTTSPCFELSLTANSNIEGIHPASPAGQWWLNRRVPFHGLNWFDPYGGKGGLGASSAQFLATYLATCSLLQMQPMYDALLKAYYQSAWQGEGLKPSGYDVLAQSQNRCVYINKEQGVLSCYEWGFPDIAFLLLHSGQKLATHYHLKSLKLPCSVHHLNAIVELARIAFVEADSEKLVDAINQYHQALVGLQLVAKHSLEYIESFKKQPEILAAKGCGALGADILLLIVAKENLKAKSQKLLEEGWTILASSENLYTGRKLIRNKGTKLLEILP